MTEFLLAINIALWLVGLSMALPMIAALAWVIYHEKGCSPYYCPATDGGKQEDYCRSCRKIIVRRQSTTM